MRIQFLSLLSRGIISAHKNTSCLKNVAAISIQLNEIVIDNRQAEKGPGGGEGAETCIV